MKVENGKFACDACGKRFTWKPQLAGKKARCSCGASMVVPAADDAPAGRGDAPDDLYDFAEPAIPAAKPARPVPATAAASPAMPAMPAAKTIGYRSVPTKENTAKDRFSFDEMTHPPRDLYVPLALLVLGVIGFVAWAISLGAGPGFIAIVSLVTGVSTLIKTAVLIGLAFIFAPMLGISFGDARTAVLKFAAIIVFTDAVGLWFDELIEMAGGMPSGRRARGRIFWLEMFLIAGLISAMCYYLFDMDSEDTGMFAIPFAIVSRVLEFIFALIVGAIIEGIVAGAAAAGAPPPAPAPPAAPGRPAAAAPAPSGPALQANARDREIERIIGSGSRLLTEANEYNQSQPQKGKREPALVNQFYGAGAKRVYIEMGGRQMVVQLPDDAASRARCFALGQQYHAESSGATGAVPKEGGQRFLELGLAPTGGAR